MNNLNVMIFLAYLFYYILAKKKYNKSETVVKDKMINLKETITDYGKNINYEEGLKKINADMAYNGEFLFDDKITILNKEYILKRDKTDQYNNLRLDIKDNISKIQILSKNINLVMFKKNKFISQNLNPNPLFIPPFIPHII